MVATTELGRAKKKSLEKFLDLHAAIPSHDRLHAICRDIKLAEVETCLISWIATVHDITGGQVIAIDGKTLGRSFDSGGSKAAIHRISA